MSEEITFDEPASYPLRIYTLGCFEVYLNDKKLNSKDWGRDKAIQLFQFLFLARNRRALHKEQIVDKLWENDIDDQGFKVALHGINKAIEPDKKSHAGAKFIIRVGQTYQLNLAEIWIDAIAFEKLIAQANNLINDNKTDAIHYFKKAIALHKGDFLPERVYEDWSSDERERLQLQFLSASISLSELLLKSNPAESIRLCQEALLLDIAWEDAYRIQMEAYYKKGNRPMAIKTYEVCKKVLFDEMGLSPLPETKSLYQKIIDA